MQADLGKLFIGGISWETSEDRLKEYFSTFGEVVEAVIMKDRTTGRARGFGFIVFSDAAVADRVIKEKHNIDGRMVEAKKAVPRDDQTILSRNSSSVQGSPGPGRTRKIFVGGLASTVTESDFKKYFEQFGTITDVVVMYDHNTQRPRGFGFITYDSEEAVDRVLVKTFHELNGKMVEVKRAVPKELSPGPSRSPISGYNNYGLNNNNNRLNSYVNGFSQGYGLGGYGVRMDARFDPIASGRSEFPPPFGSNYGMGMNFEGGVNGNYGGASGNFGYGRGLNPYYMGNSVSNRFGSPVGYDGGNVGSTSLFSSTRNLWGNGGLSYGSNSLTGSTAFMGSGSGVNVERSSNVNWGGSSAAQGQGGGGGHGGNGLGSSVGPGNLGYVGAADSSYNLVMRNNAAPTSSSYASSNGGGGYDGPFSDFYTASSFYGDPTWKAQATDRDASTSFAYALGNASPTSDVSNKASAAYVGGYTLTKRHSDTGTGLSS